ncbi:MAG TPA: response regulator [Caulobacteraceae bacterium]|nr:response regulator [Caulobacteraceae bacterium]
MLVAEDDDADAYLITTALLKNPEVGAVMRARDGAEAMEMIEQGAIAPDLVIVDLHMPKKSGFNLLLELACRDAPHIASAVLTSSVATADQLRSKLRGADHFISKPESVEELEFALTELIAATEGSSKTRA